MGGQFSKHFLFRTSVESQEAKAHPEGSGFSSSLGSLLGRVCSMLVDAGRVLTNSLKEQTGDRGSARYNQMCSMVKHLPFVNHINFELTLRPQANLSLKTIQFCRNLSPSEILSVRGQSVALSFMQDPSRSSTSEWKSHLMALEPTQTRDSVATQRSEWLKVCCHSLTVLLLYTTVRFQRSSLKLHTDPVVPDSQVAQIDSELVQLVLTDTHQCLLQENVVYHPPPYSVAVVAREAQFRLIDLHQRSDVRCLLVRDGYSSMHLDVVLARVYRKSGGTESYSQPPEVCTADAQTPNNFDSPRNEM
ncbi:uncharacterized protein LOC122147268 [Cyprinus carpio]|uniref:Uncharacterized protein LOC122147268 n=1 Tax=Cyprinus carpio TaxID=7962 RepID=A0A9R0B7Q3_CYPCA|nr:uncharacterized protein LOC122147268 [Cyprinus carpio]